MYCWVYFKKKTHSPVKKPELKNREKKLNHTACIRLNQVINNTTRLLLAASEESPVTFSSWSCEGPSECDGPACQILQRAKNTGSESTDRRSPLPPPPRRKRTQVVSLDEDHVVGSALQSLEAPLLFGPSRLQLSYFLFQGCFNILLLLFVFITVSFSSILFKLLKTK